VLSQQDIKDGLAMLCRVTYHLVGEYHGISHIIIIIVSTAAAATLQPQHSTAAVAGTIDISAALV